ncbi:MAG: hypothetical protein WA446_18350, partial [Steroidobacteraceae bacterium]
GIPSEALPDKKSTKLGKMTERAYLAKVRYPSTLLRSVLAQPRPEAAAPFPASESTRITSEASLAFGGSSPSKRHVSSICYAE